jgi:hypothetical protein
VSICGNFLSSLTKRAIELSQLTTLVQMERLSSHQVLHGVLSAPTACLALVPFMK